MNSFEYGRLQAIQLAKVLIGKIDESSLISAMEHLDQKDPYRVIFLMGAAIMKEAPLEVFHLGGSFYFTDLVQNEIACILLKCASEMILQMENKENEVRIQTFRFGNAISFMNYIQSNGKKYEKEEPSVSEKIAPKKRKRLNHDRDLKFNLSHNLRQTVCRYLKKHGHLPEKMINLYALQYNEKEENIREYYHHLRQKSPRMPETKKRAKKSNRNTEFPNETSTD
uniref:SPK domain-containing protein n=1 Tax=Caenorhabditis tropicalis TaxID=1561998 RepID=A0A1I7UVQ3_9PELO